MAGKSEWQARLAASSHNAIHGCIGDTATPSTVHAAWSLASPVTWVVEGAHARRRALTAPHHALLTHRPSHLPARCCLRVLRIKRTCTGGSRRHLSRQTRPSPHPLHWAAISEPLSPCLGQIVRHPPPVHEDHPTPLQSHGHHGEIPHRRRPLHCTSGEGLPAYWATSLPDQRHPRHVGATHPCEVEGR